jgi:tetratricopeptide (TPR) repeat protein
MKINSFTAFYCSIITLIFLQCTPKVTEETQTTPVKTEIEEPEEGLSHCTKFSDIKNGDDVSDAYVIYRDFLNLGKYDESFDMWKKVYNNAPAADGRRWTVYSDGIRYYTHFMRKATDENQKKEYINNILRLYEEIGECYPEQKDYVKARKAFDLYYEYPDLESDDTKYNLFKEVIDAKQLETYVFVLNPFTKLMVDKFILGEIDTIEAQHYADLVPKIVKAGLMKGEEIKSWVTVQDYAVPYIERLEAVKGFFDCQYFRDKYIPMYDADPTNCDEATAIYSKLRYGGCEKSDEKLREIYSSLVTNNCIEIDVVTSGPSVVSSAYSCLREGDYNCAIEKFKEAVENADDNEKKANYNFIISKIYYAHLKNYPRSRQYALTAAGLKSNWGDPYILIGKLYASSGPLCGPGRGFDSQVVTWPAIDKWSYARSIDSSVASEANNLINKYQPYMPSREDIFQRGLRAQDDFKVECWIQEKTKVRTAD